jgi:hypothetical protein
LAVQLVDENKNKDEDKDEDIDNEENENENEEDDEIVVPRQEPEPDDEITVSSSDWEIQHLVNQLDELLAANTSKFTQFVKNSALKIDVNLFCDIASWTEGVMQGHSSAQLVQSSIDNVVNSMKIHNATLCFAHFMRALVAMCHMASSNAREQESFQQRLQHRDAKKIKNKSKTPRPMTGDEMAVAFCCLAMTPVTRQATWFKSARYAYSSCVRNRQINITTKDLRACYESYTFGLLFHPLLLLVPAIAWPSPTRYTTGLAISTFLALKNRDKLAALTQAINFNFSATLLRQIQTAYNVHTKNDLAIQNFLEMNNYRQYIEFK